MTPILILIVVFFIIIIIKILNIESFSGIVHKNFLLDIDSNMENGNSDSKTNQDTLNNIINMIKKSSENDRYLNSSNKLPSVDVNNNLNEYIHKLKVMNNKKIIEQKWKNMAIMKYKLFNILDSLENVNSFDIEKLEKHQNFDEMFHKDHYLKKKND